MAAKKPVQLQDGGPSKLCVTLKERAWTRPFRPPPCGNHSAPRSPAPQAAWLAAISLGLSRNFLDDHEMLRHGMVVYDALYAWCKEGKHEVHTWNPGAYK